MVQFLSNSSSYKEIYRSKRLVGRDFIENLDEFLLYQFRKKLLDWYPVSNCYVSICIVLYNLHFHSNFHSYCRNG